MTAATQLSPRELVGSILDPEMPMVTLADLGIIRDVADDDTGAVIVTITPTYSGCPAMGTIRDDITATLNGSGYHDVEIRTSLQPAWSTDWITDEGRRKLVAAGYSPPGAVPRRASGPIPLTLTARPRIVACPQCGSERTQLVSEFGATLCKAHYRCTACGEPFDHVKEI
ncbi:1,2-phenylacetyl-CoA epoxidase subunit PaaD [Gordonia rhizosphera]|uniref:Phenylacetate-CoA oxygenase subunit PaaJ n=1 Tax=Gordonia rhizosphera NBRC 16068 TaxID=1108045 RepID=K6VZG4_9ACTN|nr:1,2-phenylacetyl-CoA epoxidase subunit PaaD [Gordonia rhizosphera]GAB92285.1 phenylacetate-CoA oxygenase subunit PaaJ [Gordonia rhizosphera NBRC 16068]